MALSGKFQSSVAICVRKSRPSLRRGTPIAFADRWGLAPASQRQTPVVLDVTLQGVLAIPG
jgi:hypothetical protein